MKLAVCFNSLGYGCNITFDYHVNTYNYLNILIDRSSKTSLILMPILQTNNIIEY